MKASEKREFMKIVPPGKKKCVWMEAGVVSYKLCDHNFDCSTCSYDHAMQDKVTRHKEDTVLKPVAATADKFTETWVEKMMQLPANRRKCRYMITGEVGRKICPSAYECGTCSFDQMMQERLQAEPLPVHARSQESGFELAEDFYYHEGHTWAKPEYGGRVRVGLDDFAQKLIGKLGRVELPNIGQEVKQGEVGFQIRRNGEIAKILSPMDGIVAHVNDKLRDQPELANESPYESGWLFTIEPTKLRKNLKGLYYGQEARNFINEEKEKLFAMAHEDLRLAADGGGSVDDISQELEGQNWAKFVKTFLKT
ncbi:MAG: glycine cleavage system protein H [Desulfobacterales bacterium]|uniref:Glycine cleavage system protein H n=1 Tax=Candidatus Desulfatibia profunda TaxID=2841695 RepID=A0A8J6NRX7_9BACT|nr:glycine cleavage system protein H [Candidatus Desulfatibia profunda]MBL7179001.1 glycine cleavage system protein H [Desulfobacterales bacterium]